ncbi:uncharacterized protein DFL_007184 [Arthrobotrys flagrans]|uniref:Uncharacterized protein n=1 Tax=Arthrobotrys flagrans TaxID=97331 RepID=A0A436ZV18_ARTFL|nr:hypothetical protein DFL_007184 [Arthrobotrys flagrans]
MPKHAYTPNTVTELESLNERNYEAGPAPHLELAQDPEAQPAPTPLPPFLPLLTDLTFPLGHPYFLATVTINL